jgi:hypothetical protein
MGQLILLLLVFLTVSASAAESPVYSWGATEKGLRIGVARVNGDTVNISSSEILIAFENMSKSDVPFRNDLFSSELGENGNMMLYLGEIWNNGTATRVCSFLNLLVTNPYGVTQRFLNADAMVGGVGQPFQVPLPVGATYQIRCPLRWFHETPMTVKAGSWINGTIRDLPAGSYQLAVEFKGSDHKSDSYSFWPGGSAKSGNIPLTITDRDVSENSELHSAATIGKAMTGYARQHNEKYPQGQSSIEIFQQLIDQKYISDPSILYFPMTGKTKATSNKLKPENVCWDVTDGVQTDDPDSLPVVFTTGYKIDYVSGGKAHPLVKPELPGIAVGYKPWSASFYYPTADGIHVIDPTFDPKGKVYRQLTPDGPLP